FPNDAWLDAPSCDSFGPDQCCHAGCQGDNPSGTSFDPDCCANFCGDGFVNSVGGETCDGTARGPGVTCLQTCRPPGAGVPLPGQCTCCGDGNIDSLAGEQCEPSLNNGTCSTPTGAPGTCNNLCQCTASCGDGNIDPGEQCDPHNTAQPCRGGQTGNATTCQCTGCGDGVVTAPEECDPPNGTTCDANCQTIIVQQCGNGIVEGTEQCDGATCSVTDNDGDVVPGTCVACQCTPNCVVEGSGCGDNDEETICSATSGTTTGVASLVTVVHPTILAQWLAAFAIPGGVFAGLKIRRR